MRIKSFAPRASLSNLVSRFTLVESDEAMENTLVPDTSLSLAIRLVGSIELDSVEGMQVMDLAAVSGLRTTPRKVRYATGSACLVVRFVEGAAGRFLSTPAHEIVGATVGLRDFRDVRDVLGGAAYSRLEPIAESESLPNTLHALESFLEIRSAGNSKTDSRIALALKTLDRHSGNIRIAALAREVGWSLDSFEKAFRAEVGATPKQYAGILRMRRALDLGKSGVPLGDLPHRVGCFDQSHFIREFKRFTGRNPTDYFGSPPAW